MCYTFSTNEFNLLFQRPCDDLHKPDWTRRLARYIIDLVSNRINLLVFSNPQNQLQTSGVRPLTDVFVSISLYRWVVHLFNRDLCLSQQPIDSQKSMPVTLHVSRSEDLAPCKLEPWTMTPPTDVSLSGLAHFCAVRQNYAEGALRTLEQLDE